MTISSELNVVRSISTSAHYARLFAHDLQQSHGHC